MKHIALTAALAALATASTFTATARPLPPPPPVPVWSWAGCYAGNGGYAWNTGKTHYEDPNTSPDPINFVPSGLVALFVSAPSGTGGAGGLGGGAECNWQS
jgi:hypothetical protein